MTSPERMEKYWICEKCADGKQWKLPDWAMTVTEGLCGHCERKDVTMLIPTCDFIGRNKTPIWD